MDEETLPVAVWVQIGGSLTQVTIWDASLDQTVKDVYDSLPAMLRSAALEIEMESGAFFQ